MRVFKYIAIGAIAVSTVCSHRGLAANKGYTPFQAKYCGDRNGNYQRGTICNDDDRSMYCDGHGTCCTPVQQNPQTCQPPPDFRLPRPHGALQ